MKSNIIFCGLSHLSLNYGAASVDFCKHLYFFDFKNKINNFHNKKILIKEPKLNSILKKNKNKISFSDSIDFDLKNSIIVVAIDINTNQSNKSNYKYINKLLDYIISNSKFKKNPLIIMSQVQPGFTRNINWPKNLLYYQVETLIFGKAIERAKYPERIIVGTHEVNQKINSFYKKYLDKFNCPILKMKFEEAELSKMYINAYLVNDVILTNLLSSISKKLNLDWSRSSNALKLDKRIGMFSYLNPGLGISGGNLERDIYNLSKISKNLKIDDSLFQLYIKQSQKRKKWLVDNINKLKRLNIIKRDSKIGIIGITYKEDTNSIKNSPSILIFNHLKNNKKLCYDKNLFNQKMKFYNMQWSKIAKIYSSVDILFIMHNDSILNRIKIGKNVKAIFDPYSFIKSKNIEKETRYFNL